MIRRYSPIAKSRGTQIPVGIRAIVQMRAQGRCEAAWITDWPLTEHDSSRGLDHVRASHAMGKKTPSEEWNLIQLCNGCHAWKTEHGREARPLLLAYLARFYGEAA